MFRITELMADYLLANRRNAQMPGLLKDELKPYVQRNTHTLGFITPAFASESDSKFMIELAVLNAQNSEEIEMQLEDPAQRTWWLYKREETKGPAEPIEVKRYLVDKYFTDQEKEIDIADCALMMPEDALRSSAQVVYSLGELFNLLPDLKDCLDPEKEKTYEPHNHHREV